MGELLIGVIGIGCLFAIKDYNYTKGEYVWKIKLHYLDMADGTPVSNQAVNFGELKDGLIRGVKFEKTMELELNRFFFIIDIINVFILEYKRIELQNA